MTEKLKEQESQSKEPEIDLEVVVDDGRPDAEPRRGEDDDDGDRRTKSGGEDRGGEDDKDDALLSPEDREKRERRRKERQLRKERREAKERELEELRREVAELRGQTRQVDRRLVTGEFRRVEAGLAEAKRQVDEAKRLMDESKGKENWGAHAEALEAYTEAKNRAERLEGMRQQYIEVAQRQEAQPDPAVARRAREWRSRNVWYDPEGGDQDSRIAATIDEGMAEEGFDPKTQRYWEELDRRLATALPHRVKKREDAEALDDDIDDEASPTTGSGRERAPAQGKKVYRISSQRKAALIEMGALDDRGMVADKKLLDRMLKSYQDWDKRNGHLLKQGR